MLVSMYLKAQRSGDASLETPSIQNFKQELKNLASMIGDLQTPQTLPPAPAPMPTHTPQPSTNITNHYKPMPASGLTQTIKESATALQNNGSNFSGANNSLGQLDLQSLQILADVKQNLNLSSDIEALRALISLGYKQFKKMN
ncbi:MAG: hypothetical protein ABL930_13655, partial [Pseudobdellovibrio sp.]